MKISDNFPSTQRSLPLSFGRMWSKKNLFLLALLSIGFSNPVDINILVHNYTSIQDGEFVFNYEEGQDAVFSLSFTPKHLNVDNIELLWEFQHKKGGKVEKICTVVEKPLSFKDGVEFSGNFADEDVSITVHNISNSDSGYYICWVSDFNNMKIKKQPLLLKIDQEETENPDALKVNKGGVLFDTDSKVVFIVIVMCMIIIFVCTLISLVKRRETNKKEATDNGIL